MVQPVELFFFIFLYVLTLLFPRESGLGMEFGQEISKV